MDHRRVGSGVSMRRIEGYGKDIAQQLVLLCICAHDANSKTPRVGLSRLDSLKLAAASAADNEWRDDEERETLESFFVCIAPSVQVVTLDPI